MKVVIPRELDDIVTPVNPLGAVADEHTVDWAREHGLVRTAETERRLAATRPGTLAAHCYPTAARADLCLLADWMTAQQIELFRSTEAQLGGMLATLKIADELEVAALNCVAMLRAWMRGHVEWGRSTARYLEVEQPQSNRAADGVIMRKGA